MLPFCFREIFDVGLICVVIRTGDDVDGSSLSKKVLGTGATEISVSCNVEATDVVETIDDLDTTDVWTSTGTTDGDGDTIDGKEETRTDGDGDTKLVVWRRQLLMEMETQLVVWRRQLLMEMETQLVVWRRQLLMEMETQLVVWRRQLLMEMETQLMVWRRQLLMWMGLETTTGRDAVDGEEETDDTVGRTESIGGKGNQGKYAILKP